MFQHQGIWLPDGEQHFPQWMSRHGELVDGKGTYQIRKLRAALQWCRYRRVAVDVGAHVGLWSMQLARQFQAVHAFEPVTNFALCWHRNCADWDGENAFLHDCALGSVSGRVTMRTPVLAGGIDSGGTHVDPTAEDGDVDLRSLDSFNLEQVDFMKIDCEGYEVQVLAGARATLERCRPCVIVEQKPHKLGENYGIKGTPAVDFLRGLGAHLRTAISGDYVLSWDALQ